MKTPEALVEASVSVVPRVSVPVCVVKSVVPVRVVKSVVPACVVSRCVYTSVWKCVLRRTHSAGERRCVRETPCVKETPCVEEPPCMNEPPCMRETLCATPSVPSCVEETPRMSETPCASGVVASVPACVLLSTPCVKGAPQVEETTYLST